MQIKNLFRHGLENPFVLATAIAAFLHSTWTVSVFFGGNQPSTSDTWAYLGWLAPGVLLAFSLDIGLLSTANKLARGENVRGLRVTFFVLAAFMFMLQWAYLIHHTPLLELSAGVRAEWKDGIQLLRDMIIWVLPALLPISVTLYTFSAGGTNVKTDVPTNVPVAATETQEAPATAESPLSVSPNGHGKHVTANIADES